MKIRKKINKKLILGIAIALITTIATGTYAIYKNTARGKVDIDLATVIANVHSTSSSVVSLDPNNTSVAYSFSVNNFETKDRANIINPVLCDYYIKIDGINDQLVQTKLYYINQGYEEVELSKETTGKFAGYYKTNQELKIIDQQTDNYILRMSIIGTYTEDTEMNINIDLGYIQKYGEEKIELPANAPKLAQGMIPVKWNSETECWTKAASDNNTYNWYSYINQKWANAIYVKENGIYSREYYETASEGIAIKNDDILAMYVWIPRFVYKIPSDFYHKTLTEDEIMDDLSNENLIDVSFSQGTNDNFNSQITVYDSLTVGKDANDTWITCPAFQFGDKELEGFWMSKFNASEINGEINVIPGKTVRSGINMNTIITKIRNMEASSAYGWTPLTGTLGENQIYTNDNNGFDTHLTKNSEWAATTFLAHSKYGKNKKSINHVDLAENDGVTGESYNIETVYVTNETKTTTGNIYGVYDMGTKTWNRVSAVVGGAEKSNSSVFEAMDNRYKDVYVVPNGVNYTLTTSTQKSVYEMFQYINGAAIWEISSAGGTYQSNGNIAGWYNGRSNISSGSNLMINRGGSYSANGKTIASPLAFGYISGSDTGTSGFRPSISVCDGL